MIFVVATVWLQNTIIVWLWLLPSIFLFVSLSSGHSLFFALHSGLYVAWLVLNCYWGCVLNLWPLCVRSFEQNTSDCYQSDTMDYVHNSHIHWPELSRRPSLALVTVRRPEAAAAVVALAIEEDSPLPVADVWGTWVGESNPMFSCFFKSLASLAICSRCAM